MLGKRKALLKFRIASKTFKKNFRPDEWRFAITGMLFFMWTTDLIDEATYDDFYEQNRLEYEKAKEKENE